MEIRRVQRSSGKGGGGAAVECAAERWAEIGGSCGEWVKSHFIESSKSTGLPHKARVLILRLLWRRTLLPASSGERNECDMCSTQRWREGDEHTFMTCATAKKVWLRVLSWLEQSGVAVEPCGDMLVGPASPPEAPRGIRGARLWRTVWSGVIWGLWRAYNAARHGDKDDLADRAWGWAKGVWEDHLRVRAARLGGGGGSVRRDDGLLLECRQVWSKLGGEKQGVDDADRARRGIAGLVDSITAWLQTRSGVEVERE
jgi:hypothetical protein